MKEPAFIPTTEALRTVPRDLRFHPSTVASPQRLSAAQVADFNRDGYLSGLGIFQEEEIAAIRRYFDELLARTLAAGAHSYSISTAHLRHARVYDLLTEPRIVAYVKDLLGEDVIGWGSHFFCKLPGDGKRVSWHQDASYWPLTPSKAVTVWLAIDDASVENACVRFIPRSHWLGHLTYTLTENDDSDVLNQTVGVEQLAAPFDNQLRAGEISIHSAAEPQAFSSQPSAISSWPLAFDLALRPHGRRAKSSRPAKKRISSTAICWCMGRKRIRPAAGAAD